MMMRKDVKWVIATLSLVALLLAACAPSATPTPAPPPSPTRAAAAPTLAPAAPTAAAPAPTARPAAPPTVAPAPASPAAPRAEQPRYGGVLKTVNREDPASLDEHQSASSMVLHALAPAYNLLLQNDTMDESKLVPDIAQRWEASADGKAYTFYLNKGIKFHDGTPLTAADVKTTFERIAWPPKGTVSVRGGFFLALDKVETPDDYTVKFLLKYPQASFPQILGLPQNFIISRKLLEAKGDYTKDVMGTGPFKLQSYLRGVSIEMVKNPDYFVPGRPYMDGITRYIISDYGAMNAAFKAGKLDALIGFMHNLSGPERELLKKQYPQIVIQEKAMPTARVIIFNHQRKPWTDVRVRTALDLVIERRAFIAVAAKGDGELGGMVFPGGWSMTREELLKLPGYRQPKDQDVAEAKRLLAEAGFPNGFKFTVTTRNLYDYSAAAVLIKDQAKAINLEASVEVLEGAAYFSRQLAREFEVIVGGSSIGVGEPDLYLGHSYTTKGGQNWGSYSNPRIDELYTKQAQITNLAERQKIISEFEKIIMGERPLVPFYWRTYSSITWPYVRNFHFQANQLGFKLQDVWLAAQ